MLTVDEALTSVLVRVRPLDAVRVPLDRSLGHVLAEAVASDVDSPPHDKSIVDGYALRAADLEQGIREFDVLEEVVAGAIPTRSVGTGQATRVMTGAPIPDGADMVVMIERTTLSQTSEAEIRVTIDTTAGKLSQNIMRKAASFRRGEVVLPAGRLIRPIEVGVLAEVGCTQAPVIRRPRVAVLSTGDELVTSDQTPTVGQIRNSNGPMLIALANRCGAKPIDLGIARDDREQLRAAITKGLAADVLVLSGGVSAGVLDLVPGVLRELGVEEVFHKVRIKPGKPLWFGVREAAGHRTLVFGLPGNPVSSLVSFELFVRPAIDALAGRTSASATPVQAALTRDFEHRGDRPTYYPSRLIASAGACQIEPLAWQGSGDLRTLADATCLAHFEAGDRVYRVGELVEALPLD